MEKSTIIIDGNYFHKLSGCMELLTHNSTLFNIMTNTYFYVIQKTNDTIGDCFDAVCDKTDETERFYIDYLSDNWYILDND